jgi:hypothetical protein
MLSCLNRCFVVQGYKLGNNQSIKHIAPTYFGNLHFRLGLSVLSCNSFQGWVWHQVTKFSGVAVFSVLSIAFYLSCEVSISHPTGFAPMPTLGY